MTDVPLPSNCGVVLDFFFQNLPTPRELGIGGPAGLAWALLCLHIAARLKLRLGLKTGYTRKVFHFLIFGTVALLHWIQGVRGVCLFGAMTTLVVFYAVLRGEGHPLFEAIARESDAPRRTHYVLVPYFATLVGGLAANIIFGPVAIVGYLATGLGDAVGEPVGTRFGRHFYRAPSFFGVRSKRSLEGSAAVFAACLAAVALGFAAQAGVPPSRWLPAVLPIALGCALVEAVSPHGWDNATMQLLPSLAAWVVVR